MKITVIVVARDEERSILACLKSVAAQEGVEPPEILVVDNGSADATPELVREFAAGRPGTRLISQPRPGISPSRNAGLAEARGDYAAFLDADCAAEPGWLKALAEAMRRAKESTPPVAGVGGPSLAPLNAGLFRRAVDAAVRGFWGHHGSVQGRLAGPEAVEHLPTLNVLYDRRAVLDAGGFSEDMRNIGEDIELSHRLLRAGWSLLFVPDAAVRHRWREDPWSWARSMEVYGKGRVWLIKKHPACFQWRYLAPLLLLAATAAAPWGRLWPPAAAPLALYLALTALASLSAAVRARSPALAPLVFGVYLLTHYAYGVGELHGLLPGGPKLFSGTGSASRRRAEGRA